MATLEINGRRVEVDDSFRSLSPEQQQATVEEIAGSFGSAPQQPPAQDFRGEGGGRGTGLEAALIGARQGVTFGFGDEINAGVRAAGDWLQGKPFGENYDARLAHERGLLDQTRQENPLSAFAGEMGGAMLIPGGAMKAGASAGVNALRMGAAGATAGGLYGFGEGEGDFTSRARSAGVGAAIGGGVGVAAPFALRGVQKAAQSRATGRALDQAAEAAPSIDDLRGQSSALYKAAEARGVKVAEGSFTPLVDDLTGMAREMGADPDLTPKTWAAMRRLGEAKGGDIGWRDLETLRRITSIASTATEPADRRIAGAITEKVDDYVFNLMDGDLAEGTAKGLGEDLQQARTLWKQMRTSERLQGAMESAKDVASGYENGLRIEFRKLIRDKKFFDRLSEGEQEAIRAVVRGTTVGNLLKRVSRLSFGHGAQTNVLGASVGAGLASTAGGAIGGPIGAIAGGAISAGAGHMAGRGAERATESLARRAVGVAAGGSPTLPQIQYSGNALGRFAMPSAAGGVSLWNQ